MFCKYCGNQINDDALFCKHCGNKTKNAILPVREAVPREESPTALPNQTPIADAKGARGVKLIHKLLCTLALIALVIAPLINFYINFYISQGRWHPWLIAWIVLIAALGWVTLHTWIQKRGNKALRLFCIYAFIVSLCWLLANVHYLIGAFIWLVAFILLMVFYHRFMKAKCHVQDIGTVKYPISIFVAVGIYCSLNYLRTLAYAGFGDALWYASLVIVLGCLLFGIIYTIKKHDVVFGWSMCGVMGLESAFMFDRFGKKLFYGTIDKASILAGLLGVAVITLLIVSLVKSIRLGRGNVR